MKHIVISSLQYLTARLTWVALSVDINSKSANSVCAHCIIMCTARVNAAHITVSENESWWYYNIMYYVLASSSRTLWYSIRFFFFLYILSLLLWTVQFYGDHNVMNKIQEYNQIACRRRDYLQTELLDGLIVYNVNSKLWQNICIDLNN